MTRLMAVMRWRQLRWVACLAIVPALWACTSRKLAPPQGQPSAVVKNRFQQSVNRDLDLLFMIDDSSSMAPLQAKMRAQLPTFMGVLKALPGGLPNLHVAVVSSSLGAGKFANVPGCGPNTSGNVNGAFQRSAGCTMLNAGENYIKSVRDNAGNTMANFSGDIAEVFSCIANIGDRGCGFEHQFESVRLALQRSLTDDPVNRGFLRPDAYLAVVMITNEDDCSVPADSDLFDPAQVSLNDPYGGLQSYRCNEFGHKCDQPVPHGVDGLPMTLTNCASKEDGKLVTVAGFTEFLKSLKPSVDKILVAALTGPVAPYTVVSKSFMLGNGGNENQPAIGHSCMQNNGEYADPAIRIKQWLDGFGANATLQSICADNFQMSMTKIAQTIGKALGAQCVSGKIAEVNGAPDCQVTQRQYDSAQKPIDKDVPYCTADLLAAASPDNPCWRFEQSTQCTGADNRLLAVCYASNCTSDKPSTMTDALVACAIEE